MMAITIGSDSFFSAASGISSNKSKTDELKQKIQNNPETDEEMMEVCKSFEAYMFEQVMKEMKKSVDSEDEKNDYLEQFGDMLYQEYAKKATEGQGLGIAQMLYEAMKRNS